jgi:hypothetical protein
LAQDKGVAVPPRSKSPSAGSAGARPLPGAGFSAESAVRKPPSASF